MKHRRLIVAVSAAALLGGLAPAARAALPLGVGINVSVSPDAAVGTDVHVRKGETHQGDLVVILGDVRVDGAVTGEIVVVLGSLELDGSAGGGVVSVMSRTQIGPAARIAGNLVNVGWALDQAEASRVAGEIININFMNFIPFSGLEGGLHALVRLIYIIKLLKLAVLFVVVLLLTVLFPRRLALVASAFPAKWAWSLLAGLLAYAGVIVGFVILLCTIIGIPLGVLLLLALKVTKWFGLAALFYLMGQTMGRNLFHRDLPHMACVLGGYLLFAMISLVPLLGDCFVLAMNLLAIGIVLMTRFGTSEEPGRPGTPAAGSRPPAGPGAAGAPPSDLPAPPVIDPLPSSRD